MALKIPSGLQNLLRTTEKRVGELVREAQQHVKVPPKVVQQAVDTFERGVQRFNPFAGQRGEDPSIVAKHQGDTEYRPVKGPLFADAPSATDVTQGQLGDCYFLSTIASLAQEHPDALKQIVRDNGNGTYTVTFHKPPFFDQVKFAGSNANVVGGGLANVASRLGVLPAGETISVTVDGDFPVDSQGNYLKYGRDTEGNELWVPVMEKAWAQLWGDYGRTVGGDPATAMYLLTGSKVSRHGLGEGKADAVFADLKQAFANKELVVADTANMPWSKTAEGLVKGHAYTVLGVSERDGEKYVQIRNPWGQKEPGADGRNDGVFEMKAADFCRDFAAYHRGQVR